MSERITELLGGEENAADLTLIESVRLAMTGTSSEEFTSLRERLNEETANVPCPESRAEEARVMAVTVSGPAFAQIIISDCTSARDIVAGGLVMFYQLGVRDGMKKGLTLVERGTDEAT